MRKVKLLAGLLPAVAIPLLLTVPTPAASDEQFQFIKGIDVGPITSFDISFDDANIHTLVQSHRDTPNCGADPNTDGGVDVINTSSNKRMKTLCGFHGTAKEHGPNGVIIVDQKEVWAGDGLIPPETSTLKAVDIKTGDTVVMNTGGSGRTDELCEAVGHEIVMAANDRTADLFMTFWSTESHEMLGQLSFLGGKTPDPNAAGIVAAGGIEQCKFDPRTNRFLIAIPQPSSPAGITGVVAVVTAEKPFKVVDMFKILPSSGCDQGPHGLALGPDHQVLLGCGSPSAASLIMDDRDGHTIFPLPGVSSDEVWYNPGDNHYFLVPTNAAGTAGTLAPVDAKTGAEDAMAKAGGSSRVVAADMLKNQIYVVLPGPDDVASGGSGLCPNAANGCIGVYTAKNDDQCLAQGMPVLDHDDGDDPLFMRTRCDDDRRAENDRDR
ncbi:MAG TPA: hypothetical protein VGI22_27940 [Xanthobacteraceae bacterium]